MADNKIEIIASLDIPKSKHNIADELKQLQADIQADKSMSPKIIAGLDIDKSKTLIQSQLNNIINQANAPTIKVGIDIAQTKNIGAGLQSVQTQIKQTESSLLKLKDEFKDPITPVFNSKGYVDAEKTLAKVREHYQALGSVSVKGIYSDKHGVDTLEKMVISLNKGMELARTLKFELDDAGKSFFLASGTSDDSGIKNLEKYTDRVKAIQTNLTRDIQSIQNRYLDQNTTKPIKDTGHIEKLNAQYKVVEKSIANLANADNTTMSSMRANVDKEIAKLKDLERQYRNAEYAANQLRTKDIGQIKSEQFGVLDKFKAQVDASKIIDTSGINAEISRLKELLNTVTNPAQLTDFLNKFDVLKIKFSAANIEAKTFDDLQKSITTKINQLNNMKSNNVFFKNLDNQNVVQTQAEIDGLTSKYKDFLTLLAQPQTPESFAKLRNDIMALDINFNSVTQSANGFKSSLKETNALDTLSTKVNKLSTDIQTYYKSLDSKTLNKMLPNGKNVETELTGMLNMLQQCSSPELYNGINRGFSLVRSQVTMLNQDTNTMFNSFLANAKKFGTWMGVTTIISRFVRGIRDMARNVVELDTAMTNLKKVTDETTTTYSKFFDNAADRAKKLHIAMSDLIEQTATWAKLGYSLEEAQKLSDISAIYAKVGEVDNKSAVSDLVTVMKAFNIEAENSIRIVDMFNILGNTFATDAASLGEGMTKAASALNMGGNSLEQSLAMLTGGTEITQNSSEMANALKVFTMRIQGMKGALEELGEEYENVESISKTQTHILNLTSGKVNIFDEQNNFRATYDVLKDVSEIIDELSDPDRADLLETLFGKMRGNQGMAVIQAFQSGQIEKAYETALNSQGSAQKEFDKWLESAEAKIQKFNAQFESLSASFFNTSDIKLMIDSGTTMLSIIETIIDKLGTIPTIAGAITGVLALKNNNSWFQTIANDDGSLRLISSLKARQDAQRQAQIQLDADVVALRKYEQECNKGTVTTQTFANTMQNASLQAQQYALQIKNGTGTTDLYITQQRQLQAQTSSLSMSTKLANKAVKGLSVAFSMLKTTAIMWGVSFISEQVMKLAQSTQRAIDKSKELREELAQQTSDYSSERKTLEGLKDEYDSLAKHVDEHGNAIGLSADEYERYKDITSQVLGITPQLITGWNEEGQAISNKNNLIQQSIDLLDEEYQKTLRNSTTKAKNEKISKGLIKEIKAYNESSDKDIYDLKKSVISDLAEELYSSDYRGSNIYYGVATGISSKFKEKFGRRIDSKGEFQHNLESWASFDDIADYLYSEDSTIHQYLSEDAIENLRRDADDYFYEVNRIREERDLLYDEFAKQVSTNIQAHSNEYFSLSTESKAFVDEYVKSLDYAKVKTTDDFISMTRDAEDFVKSLWNNKGLQEQITSLYSLESQNLPIDEYISQYRTIVDDIENSLSVQDISLPVNFTSNIDDLERRYEEVISKFGDKDKEVLREFFNTNSINTVSEITNWAKLTEGVNNATVAIQQYILESNKLDETPINSVFDSMKDGTLKDSYEKIDKFKDVLKDISEGNTINRDTAWELFELDDNKLIRTIELVGDEYRLSSEEVIEAKDEIVKATIREIQAEIAAGEAQQQSIKKRIDLYKQKIASFGTIGLHEVPAVMEANKEITKLNKEWQDTVKSTNYWRRALDDANASLGDTTKKVAKTADDIKEMADNLLNAYTGKIDQITSKLESQKEALEGELETLEEQLDVLEKQKETLEDNIDKHEEIADYIGSILREEVDSIKEQQEEIENSYDERIKSIEDFYDSEIEKLQEANKERERNIELEEKLLALENAKNKRVKVYNETSGSFEYRGDQDAVMKARKEVQETQANFELEDKISKLEKTRDELIKQIEDEKSSVTSSFESQIEALEEYAEKWEEVATEVTDAEKDMLAEQLFGSEWREKIKNKDTAILTKFKNNYKNYNTELNNLVTGEIASLEKSIDAKKKDIEAKDKEIQSWNDYKDKVEQAAKDIENSLNGYADMLNSVKLSESSNYAEREAALKTFTENYAGYVQSIKDAQNNIQDINSSITVDMDISNAAHRLAEYLELYRDGMLSMADIMKLDPNNATNALQIYSQIQTSGNINDIINRLKAYSTGGTADYTGLAMLHGTKTSSETIFNANDSKKLYNLIHNTDNLSTMLANNVMKNINSDSRLRNVNNTPSTTINNWSFGDIVANSPVEFAKQMEQYWRMKATESLIK